MASAARSPMMTQGAIVLPDARHDRAVGDAQVFDPINLEVCVHDRQVVTAHIGRAGLMPLADRSTPKVALQGRPLYIPRDHLPLQKRAERGGMADLATELHDGYQGLQVIRIRQKVAFNVWGTERARSRQTNAAPALGPYDGREHQPAACR
jgi:hypothetical protein